MKTAIVHDWFTNYAGSERCVESFVNIWNDADVFSLVDLLNEEQRSIILKGKKANTSFIQKLPFAKTKHRSYLALFPIAIEQFDLSGYDLIISSSHAVAKGVLTGPDQLHISYCHTPIRYAWDLTHQYLQATGLNKGLKGIFAKHVLHYLRNWDVSSSNRVDYFIANSNYIAKKIFKFYRRKAEIIYPPVDTDRFAGTSPKDDYYLTASRFVPYKKIELIAQAFSEMPDKKLVIIGEGPEEKRIKSRSGANIEFAGYQPPEKLKEYMQRAKAFVFAAEEDFGIVVVEALSAGTPVIAFNKGGTAETVIDGKNGILFDNQSADSIKEAVKRFDKQQHQFNPAELNEYAKQFDRKVFEQKIRDFVMQKYKDFKEGKLYSSEQ